MEVMWSDWIWRFTVAAVRKEPGATLCRNAWRVVVRMQTLI